MGVHIDSESQRRPALPRCSEPGPQCTLSFYTEHLIATNYNQFRTFHPLALDVVALSRLIYTSSFVLTLLSSSWPNCDRIIDYCITTDPSSLNNKSRTIPGSATVIKGGGTTEGFVFDPEIASLVHQLWRGLVIPEIMDRNLT
jgi:hypothetical protein